MLSNLIKGAGYLTEGIKLLGHKRVLPFVWLPILLNVLIYYFLFQGLYELGLEKIDAVMSNLPSWLDFIGSILRWIFIILMSIIIAFSFSTVATLLGAPFYGILAEQVAVEKTGDALAIPLSWKGLLTIVPRTLLRETQKLLYYIVRVIPLFLLWLVGFLIAVVQPLISVLWFVFGARMLSIQYIDFAFDNDGINFRTMKKTLKNNRAISLGFGAATQAALMIPFISVFIVPAAVCGATALYCDHLVKEKNSPSQ